MESKESSWDDGDPKTTLLLKVPFFILGVVLGQAVVWMSLKWVPMALVSARQALGS